MCIKLTLIKKSDTLIHIKIWKNKWQQIKKRVQISMTEEIASKFDELTEFYGLSKSGLFAVLIRRL